MFSHRLLVFLAGLGSTVAATSFDGSRFLWFRQPARLPIYEDAMPIGNGRLAVMAYGGGAEVLGINENSIWDGPFQERIGVNASKTIPIVRQMLLDDQLTEARVLAYDQINPTVAKERAFSYFGNFNLDFGHADADMEDYVRWLDTKEGTAGVNYTVDGVSYSREYVVSFPHQVIAARFTASSPGALNINSTMTRLKNSVTTASASKDGNAVTLTGTSGQPDNESPILWTGEARFVAEGATVSANGANLVISKATVVDLFFDAETNFRHESRELWEADMRRKVAAATELGFEAVRKAAVDDVSELIDRVALDLGSSPNGLADLPTDERIAHARNTAEDLQLSTLVFNYGRHLLVASSRDPGTKGGKTLPSNLVGIWNNSTTAAWGGKYTININTEMNYWPAGPTNLIDTQPPLFDLMARALPHARDQAKHVYNCPGAVIHHNLDMWGDSGLTDNYTSSTMWPVGSAWLSWHMMDHYRFTGDKTFLRDVAYPYFVELATFYQCYMFEYNGYKVTGPSISPENSFVVPDNMSIAGNVEAVDIGPSMDHQLIHEVFRSLLDSAEILGIHDDTVMAAQKFLPTIMPPQIGSLGQILEWRREYKEKAAGHKHLSPLWALMPGRQFSKLIDPTLGEAAEVLLDRRVDHGAGSTGWSRTWLINQMARVFRGDDAWKMVEKWFAVHVTPYNLFNTDVGGPKFAFQIDGNFAFTHGIAEMLLQSHADVVHILPALPSAVPTGSVKGLVARGNFLVDIEWSRGQLVKATITSQIGGKLALRYMDAKGIMVNGKIYTEPIDTGVGVSYVVTRACTAGSKRSV